MPALSVLLFPLGKSSPIVLANGDFATQDMLVKHSLVALHKLPNQSFVHSRLYARQGADAPLEEDVWNKGGVIVRSRDSLYDLLNEETSRFFDVLE